MTPAIEHARAASAVRIGDFDVGPARRTLIIAEAGVNHDGSVDKALALVDAAVDAGADMVKFQIFRADELASADAATASYQRAGGDTSQRALLRRLELDDAAFAAIRAHCRRRSIQFLATPFGVGDVDRLCALDVPALKLASTDLNNLPLVRRAAETGLPLIVSTGASTRPEIEQAVAQWRALGAIDRLILLHCISGYPAPLENANLRAIRALHELAGVPTGFSDHTASTQIAGWAVAAGAGVLEKHFTLDRRSPGPDHAMSLEPAQLADYVRAARQAEAALGNGRLGMQAIEADVRAVARKRVVAAVGVSAGTILTAVMLTVKRPGGGIDPDQIDNLVGRRATRDIAADEALAWDMVL